MAKTNVQYAGESELFEVAMNGCEFGGVLYARVEGGCDAYLRLLDSELPGLDVERITQLRQRADQNKEIHITDLPGSILNPLTKWRARRELRDWLGDSLRLEYRVKDRLKEWVWKLADLVDATTWQGWFRR